VRATYTPTPAAAAVVERLVATAPAGLAGGGEVTIHLKGAGGHRQVRNPLPAAQLRDVLRRWVAAARAGQGELEIGE
jgi:hypothetical protein